VTDVFLSRYDGPSPAMQVARDIVKRGIYVAPIAIALGAVFWGTAGAASVAYGLAIVCVNFVLAAAAIGWGARISAAMMGAAAMFGFLIRLGLIFLAVMLVKDAGWVEMVPLGMTLIITHLGLLFWEMKYVSASLAYPGLKPARVRR
jgi:hypothetical protein